MLNSSDLLPEITFTTSRSSGPGGQHVNKVESRVTLRFDVVNSQLLSDRQKMIIQKKLSGRITKIGELVMHSQAGRSQADNKKRLLERLDKLLQKALTPMKKRKKTRPSKGAVEKRLKTKRENKEKKERRKPI